jgi:hypothetical protein
MDEPSAKMEIIHLCGYDYVMAELGYSLLVLAVGPQLYLLRSQLDYSYQVRPNVPGGGFDVPGHLRFIGHRILVGVNRCPLSLRWTISHLSQETPGGGEGVIERVESRLSW